MATAAPGAPALPLESTRRLRAVHTRTATIGLLACALAATVVLGAEGLGAIAFMGPFIAIPLVGAGLVWRFGTWAKVVGIVLGGFLLSQVVPALPEAIGHPNSFFDFVPLVMFTTGALLAVGGGIAAVVKRSDLRAEATPLERNIRWALIAIIGLLVVGSGAATMLGRTTVDAAARAGAVESTISGFEYQLPASITAGEPTSFVVSNDDRVLHTFTIDGTSVDMTITPGSEALVEVPALEPGTYTVYCHPHTGRADDGTLEGMTAELIVR